MNIDPLAEDYMHQSTYAMAANNPVYFIDINGEGVNDDFKLLVNGELKKIKETDTADRVFATDSKGKVIKDNFVTLEKDEQIESAKTIETESYDSDGNKHNMKSKTISFKSSDKASEAFKFFADNSHVEWSQVDSSKFGSFVGTSESSDYEAGASAVVDKLVRAGETDINRRHSHPRTPVEMTLVRAGKATIDQTPSDGDINVAKRDTRVNSSANIKYQVYDPVYKETYHYNHRGHAKPVNMLKKK